MILLNADISFCMVCKLWYISIRCIFKNLALKLRIYNFRGVYVCICPPHLPSSSPKVLSFIPSIFLPFPLFKRLPECLLFCLRDTFPTSIFWLLIVFYIYFYTLYTTLSLYGIIYLLFLKMSLCRCNAPYTTHF